MKKNAVQVLVVDYFQQFIRATISGKRLTAAGKKMSTGTIKNYEYVQKMLLEFEAKKQISLRVQLLNRASLKTFQKEKNYWKRFYLQFSNFLYREKGYYDNYAGGIFKILKTFFNYLRYEKGLSVGNYYKTFKTPQQVLAPVVLEPAQLQFLISNKAFEASLCPCLARAKDIFVFGCTIALRVSDLMKLEKKHLSYNGAEVYLKIFTQKTSTAVKIPLPDYAIKIIEKYKYKAGKYILPRLANTNLNIQVKKLVKKAGWTDTLIKVMSRQGKIQELKNANGKSWQFYQHITAHTMRRTAITTLLIMGVPELVVRKISGHTPGSKEFYRYVAIAQDYISKAVKIAYIKLIETDFQES